MQKARQSSQADAKRTSNAGFPALAIGNLDKIPNLQIDNNLKMILGALQGSLSITVGPDGSVRTTVTRRDGTYLCQIEHLISLGRFRRFVIEEERKDVTSERLEPILAAFFHIAMNANEAKDLDQVKILTPAQLSLGRDLVTKFMNVTKNLDDAMRGPDTRMKEYFNATAIRVRNAIAEVLIQIFKSGNQGEGVKGALASRRVPKWYYDKLTAPNVFVNPGASIEKFLFPQDATKSVALSLREALNDDMVKANWPITRGSKLVLQLIRDARFMTRYAFAGFNPADWTSPEMAKLENTKVVMHPVFFSLDHIFDPKIARKFMSSCPATGETPAAVLARALYSLLKIANLEVGGFANGEIVRHFGLTYNPELNKSIYSVLKDKPDVQDPLTRYLYTLTSEAVALKAKLFCVDMKITNATEVGEILTSILSGETLMSYSEFNDEYMDLQEKEIRVDDSIFHVARTEASVFEIFKEKALPKIKNAKDKKPGIALAPVHPEAKKFLDGFNADKKVRLARKAIEKWLKGMPTTMQVQAAEIAVAQLTDSSFESAEDASELSSEAESDED